MKKKRQAESENRLEQLQNALVYPEDITTRLTLVDPSRRIVFESEVQDSFLNFEQITHCYLFLFNDMLLITKHRKNKYTYFKDIPISTLKNYQVCEIDGMSYVYIDIKLLDDIVELVLDFNNDLILQQNWVNSLKSIGLKTPDQNLNSRVSVKKEKKNKIFKKNLFS